MNLSEDVEIILDQKRWKIDYKKYSFVKLGTEELRGFLIKSSMSCMADKIVIITRNTAQQAYDFSATFQSINFVDKPRVELVAKRAQLPNFTRPTFDLQSVG